MQQSASTSRSTHSAIDAIRARKGHLSNIWIFESPKNACRFVIKGDVAFMATVLLEGNFNVARYVIEPPPVYAAIDGETRQTQLDATVLFADGHEEWWEFKRSDDAGPHREGRSRSQLSAQAQAAQAAGIRYRVVTEEDLLHKAILFDNWLTLCAAITRARGQPMYREVETLHRLLALHSTIALHALIHAIDVDPAIMLAVVAKALQQGTLLCDLESRLLCAESLISGRSS
jgi:hypothetical protein